MEGLGINLGYLIVQIGALIVLIILMRAFAYGPITRLLEERQARIAKGLEDARQAAIARDNADAEAKKVMDAWAFVCGHRLKVGDRFTDQRK